MTDQQNPRIVSAGEWQRLAGEQQERAKRAEQELVKFAGWIERDRQKPDKLLAYAQAMRRAALLNGSAVKVDCTCRGFGENLATCPVHSPDLRSAEAR